MCRIKGCRSENYILRNNYFIYFIFENQIFSERSLFLSLHFIFEGASHVISAHGHPSDPSPARPHLDQPLGLPSGHEDSP